MTLNTSSGLQVQTLFNYALNYRWDDYRNDWSNGRDFGNHQIGNNRSILAGFGNNNIHWVCNNGKCTQALVNNSSRIIHLLLLRLLLCSRHYWSYTVTLNTTQSTREQMKENHHWNSLLNNMCCALCVHNKTVFFCFHCDLFCLITSTVKIYVSLMIVNASELPRNIIMFCQTSFIMPSWI